ncbi:MAG TPA: hypothetical protein VMW27_00025 [Thermoanaerobaculia bacterium]|nr:hypothetical protein [Thermoanaerobaculia bacterium]
MKKLVLLASGVAVLVLASVPAHAAKRTTVTLVNRSDWAIHHLFLSSTTDDSWGPDQLGKHVIEPGGSFDLTNIPCDDYDVKLVDEDGDECEIAEVGVCSGDETWKITNDDLLECEGYGE